MRIFVYGWYGHGNAGDESYKLSYREIWPDHEFIFSDNINFNDNYDLCILGGGDVVRKEALDKISFFNCPKISMSVTITDQSLSDKIFILDHIYVRDMTSYHKLINYGYTNVTYIPDISLVLKGDKDNGKKKISTIFSQNNCDLYDNIYTIVINAHLLGNPNSKSKDRITFLKFIDDVSTLIDRTNASFLFLPFSVNLPWDDRVTNGLVNSNTKFYNKNCVLYDKLELGDFLDIIAASDMMIASRFHGLIFGLSNNIPVATISFHDKISGFCDTINETFIDYYSFSIKELERKIMNPKVNVAFGEGQIKNEYLQKVCLLRR